MRPNRSALIRGRFEPVCRWGRDASGRIDVLVAFKDTATGETLTPKAMLARCKRIAGLALEAA